jgi:hypothetical protein
MVHASLIHVIDPNGIYWFADSPILLVTINVDHGLKCVLSFMASILVSSRHVYPLTLSDKRQL